MQEMEDEVLDMHKATIDLSPHWQQMDISLINMTDEVGYDVDGRCRGGERHADMGRRVGGGGALSCRS